ncbi:FAD-dependent oxidoreductase [Sulfitobacter sp.]|uniref:FAD-dependent oxidoreductase n=1 Tax=Sulfitobacter sp. TaxID=1903071 RepID=UPI000C0F1453|nr:FAD-dependent oxidoreductase [Roseobacter sp.]MBV50306.1 FAD-dependent oxidoreductase [Roseobacter sp.]PHR06915.1 MAG: FAD-dependent oxidoreductase [Sulfitobacter sp.]
MTEVTVIGAGVSGLCVARSLKDRGASVTVVERDAELGPRSCSWWAGGMLAPYCEGTSADQLVVRLGLEAADWWAAHTQATCQRGSLVLSPTRDRAELAQFAGRTEGYVKVDGPQIAALEPDLADRFASGLYFEAEAHLAPRAALAQLRAGLVRDGTHFVQDEANPDDYARRGITVDCRGFQARDTQRDLRGVKGEMLVLSCPEVTLNRPVRMLHPRVPLYIVPRGDGVFMLGATMIESSSAAHISVRSVLELLSAAYALNPAFGEAEVLEVGVDCRPAYPDNLPRIRRDGNLISSNGLFRHGFLLAPAMARMVADLIYENIIPEVMDETPG